MATQIEAENSSKPSSVDKDVKGANGREQHPCGDTLLTALLSVAGPIGTLVGAYPGLKGIGSHPKWLEEWFLTETTSPHAEDIVDPSTLDQIKLQALGAVLERKTKISDPVRILSIEPRYFRGFRTIEQHIDLDANLVMVDGPNSSGKTSISEALEFLFTGKLQRRERENVGNPQEMENCVQNQLRPEGEETWVTAKFRRGDNSEFEIKRVLIQDYGITSTACCSSKVSLDDRVLTEAEAKELLDGHFASEAPLLMQHTLRQFVHNTPRERRDYFEQLLLMDEITYLINKAVVSNGRLPEFPSPTGSRFLGLFQTVSETASNTKSKTAVRIARKTPGTESVESALATIAICEFGCADEASNQLEGALKRVRNELEKVRLNKFPLLARLRPSGSLDSATLQRVSPTEIESLVQQLGDSVNSFKTANEAVKTFVEAERILAPAVKALVEAGLIDQEKVSQDCPLCLGPQMLSFTRVSTVLSVEPAVNALRKSKSDVANAKSTLISHLQQIGKVTKSLVPDLVSDDQWLLALKSVQPELQESAENARQEFVENHLLLDNFEKAIVDVLTLLNVNEAESIDFDELSSRSSRLTSEIQRVPTAGENASKIASNLEAAVAQAASESDDYTLRENWVRLSENVEELAGDLRWENQKSEAQKNLEKTRDALMTIRQSVLEAQRDAFSNGMSDIWNVLRRDTYSVFNGLLIPPPSGKGYEVSIRVRALLDDAQRQLDVDALKVFSESQINVLGIAAFITRSILMGHRFIIFDDPVQSMDEDHFETFADGLLKWLMDQELQVIVLTHNDEFSKKVSWSHDENPGYATLRMRSSRKKGCMAEEGNKRVSERLKRARKCAEDGEFEEAWRFIRLAMERLYTLVKKRSDKNFNPDSWRNHTAENMWNEGVGEVIKANNQGSGRKLKEILDKTAAGAHDKKASGLTEIMNACDYLKTLPSALRIGD